MSADESLVQVRWSRTQKSTLEVRDPRTGEIHAVSATQAWRAHVVAPPGQPGHHRRADAPAHAGWTDAPPLIQ